MYTFNAPPKSFGLFYTHDYCHHMTPSAFEREREPGCMVVLFYLALCEMKLITKIDLIGTHLS